MKPIVKKHICFTSKQTPRILLLILSFLLISATSWAATYYVDKNNSGASDANSGSEAQPWLTITHAAGTVDAGDTVYVKNGVYYESGEIRVSNSGTESAPITFRNYSGHTPVIDGSKSSASKFFHVRGPNYIILDGFEVRNAYQYAIWFDGNHNTIRNCKIHDNGRDGGSRSGILLVSVVGGGLYNTISNNEIYTNAWNGIGVEGCNYTTISDNVVYGNHHQGINVFPPTNEFTGLEDGNNITGNVCFNNDSSGIYTRYQRNNIISNNVIYNNNMWGILLHSGGTGNPGTGNSYVANTKVLQNTIVNNNYDGLYIHTGSNVIVKNNLFYKNNHAPAYPAGDGKANIRIDGINGCQINNNFYVEYPNTTGPFYYSGSKTLTQWQALGFDRQVINEGSPGFVDINSAQFNLTASSDAIDAGVDLTSDGITKDIAKEPRPQGEGFDIGAYEFKAANNVPSAVDDYASVSEDVAIDINVLANDSDIDGDTLTLDGTTQPVNGSVSIVGTVIRYMPNANYNGGDSFSYTVSDGNGGASTAKVTVTVTSVLDPPSNLHIY